MLHIMHNITPYLIITDNYYAFKEIIQLNPIKSIFALMITLCVDKKI